MRAVSGAGGAGGRRRALWSISTAYSFANAEAEAFVARQSGNTLSNSDKQALDTFVGALKTQGLWTLADQILWLNPRLPFPLLNLLGVSNTATMGAGVIAVPDNPSFFSPGTAGNAISGMASASGAQFQQNSASLGAFFIEGGNRSAVPVSDSTVRNFLSPSSSTNKGAARVNSNTNMISAADQSGHGFMVATRIGATDSRLYKSGVEIASSTAASQARTTNPILFGANNMPQAYALTWIGGGLNAVQAAALCSAVETFMSATGVHPLTSTATANPLSAITNLPDASGIGVAGKGIPCTGLAALPDGRWLIGIGLASISNAAGIAILSADKSTVELQRSYASWGMSAYSTQGVAVDLNGDGLCIAKNSGTEARLVRFELATGNIIGSSAIPNASANGIAVDTKRNRYIISTTSDNAIRWYLRDTLAADTSVPLINFPCDQLCYHAATDSILATGGANDVDGILRVYSTREYGAFWLIRNDTVVGSLAVEGVALTDFNAGRAMITIADDGHTHNTAYNVNRLHRYDSVLI